MKEARYHKWKQPGGEVVPENGYLYPCILGILLN